MRRWVFDASPLIALGNAGRLSLLYDLDIAAVIPEAVASEIDAGDTNDPMRVWLRESSPFPVVPVPILPIVAAWGLGNGESAAISYALANAGFEPVLDDRAARTCAQTLGVRPRGTLGLFVLAKRQGAIETIRPAIDDLIGAGYYLSPDLIALVLADAGEAESPEEPG